MHGSQRMYHTWTNGEQAVSSTVYNAEFMFVSMAKGRLEPDHFSDARVPIVTGASGLATSHHISQNQKEQRP